MPSVCKIALVGKMKSGKTTSTTRLTEELGFTRMSLAAPVKEASVAALNAVLEYLGRPDGMTLDTFERDKGELRPVAQFIGTDFGRKYLGPDTIWIDMLLERIGHYEFGQAMYKRDVKIVVDDCRFVNEAEALRDSGFTIVRIQRPEFLRTREISQSLFGKEFYGLDPDQHDALANTMTHPSEMEVDSIVPDVTLINDRSIERLYQEIDAIVDMHTLDTKAAREVVDSQTRGW